jgi:hypothetical protein
MAVFINSEKRMLKAPNVLHGVLPQNAGTLYVRQEIPLTCRQISDHTSSVEWKEINADGEIVDLGQCEVPRVELIEKTILLDVLAGSCPTSTDPPQSI